MENDEFGRDPAVRSMRRVFAQMEKLQQEILSAAALFRFDPRLRAWREQALQLFDQAWVRATRRDLIKTEEEAALLYAHCLARVLERSGISVSRASLTGGGAFEQIIQEMLK